jgi:TrmH family RNA methyltransferase
VVLEGFHPLKHALRFGAQIEEVVCFDEEKLSVLAEEYAPDLAAAIRSRALEVSRQVFKQLGPYEPHTGVVSIARRRIIDPATLLADEAETPLILLEDPRHRGNLGAVIRVAAAAEAAGVLSTGSCDPWDPVVVRGSAGLHFAVPVAHLNEQLESERPLYAFDPLGEPFVPGEIPSRAILAFGSERQGLSAELLSHADHHVSLPMRTGVSSLNLATSVAAVLYAIRLASSA